LVEVFRGRLRVYGLLVALVLTQVPGTSSRAQGAGDTDIVTGQPAIGNDADARLIATLIRSTLIALHHAMVSGNYSVLRDLAAPTFRESNTAMDLGIIFAPIRARGINLEAVAVLQPNLKTAVITESRLLRLVGVFETTPTPIHFDLAFQVVGQSWALLGMTIIPIDNLDGALVIQGNGVPKPTLRPELPFAPAGVETEQTAD
jgi:hypothetical protein